MTCKTQIIIFIKKATKYIKWHRHNDNTIYFIKWFIENRYSEQLTWLLFTNRIENENNHLFTQKWVRLIGLWRTLFFSHPEFFMAFISVVISYFQWVKFLFIELQGNLLGHAPFSLHPQLLCENPAEIASNVTSCKSCANIFFFLYILCSDQDVNIMNIIERERKSAIVECVRLSIVLIVSQSLLWLSRSNKAKKNKTRRNVTRFHFSMEKVLRTYQIILHLMLRDHFLLLLLFCIWNYFE